MDHKKLNDLVSRIKKDKNWIEEFEKIVDKYYEAHPGGGSMHIVLDDGNLEDENIIWCCGYACGAADEIGSNIGNLLRWMTLEQRERFYNRSNYG